MANPNPQREAIRCLINNVPAQDIDWDPRDAESYVLACGNVKPVYFWGVSDSDFENRPGDTPVIVMGLKEYQGEWWGAHLFPKCTHVVLQSSREKYGLSEQVVGLLEVHFSKNGLVVFEPVGRLRTFVLV